MQNWIIPMAVYIPAYALGRLVSDYTGHGFLLGWCIGGVAILARQKIGRWFDRTYQTKA